MRSALALARLRSTRVFLLLLCGAGCGAGGSDVSVQSPNGPAPLEEWPSPSTIPADAIRVKELLASPDGSQVRVKAYLVASAPPCAPCVAPPPPATCAPCPTPAATFSDDVPGSAIRPASATLRAVGLAGNLATRHVGRLFLLSGTFRIAGGQAPELQVSDIRALPAP